MRIFNECLHHTSQLAGESILFVNKPYDKSEVGRGKVDQSLLFRCEIFFRLKS